MNGAANIWNRRRFLRTVPGCLAVAAGASLIERLGVVMLGQWRDGEGAISIHGRPMYPDLVITSDFETDPAIAVGLRYEAETMKAPTITGVHKGVFAKEAMDRALRNDVPVFLDDDNDSWLPRALIEAARSSTVIPEPLYAEVAWTYASTRKRNPATGRRLLRYSERNRRFQNA